MKLVKRIILVLLIGLACLGPWALISGSFAIWHKTTVLDLLLLRNPTLDNWRNLLSPAWWGLWVNATQIRGMLLVWIRNSVMVSVTVATLQTVVSVSAGYALARYQVIGGRGLITMLVIKHVVPMASLFVPLYLVFRWIGIRGLTGYIVAMAVSGEMVFLTRQFAKGLAGEVLDAARVDGASEWQILWHIGLPMLKPLAAMSFGGAFSGAWVNMTLANVLLQDKTEWLITQGLVYMMSQFLALDGKPMLGMIAAISLLTTAIPMAVWLLVQPYIDEGMKGLIEE